MACTRETTVKQSIAMHVADPPPRAAVAAAASPEGEWSFRQPFDDSGTRNGHSGPITFKLLARLVALELVRLLASAGLATVLAFVRGAGY